MRPIRDVLAEFSKHRVLVFGDVILDEYLTGDCTRISPEAPVPIMRVQHHRATLGGAANTAANIAALGGHVTLVGLVGDDEGARELERQCEALGIQLVAVADRRPTIRKVRVVGHQQQLLRLGLRRSARHRRCRSRTGCSPTSSVSWSVPQSSWFPTTRRARSHSGSASNWLRSAHAAGKQVVIDPRPQHRSFYAGCDYMTPNWQESLALLGQSEGPATEDAVAACGRELVSRFGCHVVMTLGSRGISFFHRDALGDFRVPALAKEVFDVSGAGDTVVAAFALALASGCSHMDAIDLANRAAGVVVAKHGTATVSPQELLSEAETESRALGRDELRDVSARLRAQGKRIVTLNGSFDVMHTGHLHILKEAKRQGDVLIVGVNSDASVRSYKGPGRPINSEQQRAEMLLANRYVDYVHVFDETVPMAFIEAARPDVHVNGAEYGDECVEAPTVRRLGARLHLVPRLPGLSTTELLQRTKPAL